MQQRQLRLGDILDDYCPRERRLTNHAVVAMIGADVKQTRCTTCDAEHAYKHARVPRQRKKSNAPAALYAQVLAGGPKKVVHDQAAPAGPGDEEQPPTEAAPQPIDEQLARNEHDDDLAAEAATPEVLADAAETGEPVEDELTDEEAADADEGVEEGPVHRPLIRAQLPRHEGQVPPSRPAPDFTIRQPGGGRQNRFRPRHQRSAGPLQGNRSGGNFAGGPMRSGGAQRRNAGRPPVMSHSGRRQGPGGRKRSK